MYYQILVETTEKIGKTKTNKVITELDKSNRSEIITDIVNPYLMNEEFIVNGYFLKKENVSRLKIMTTEQSTRALSKYENDNMPSGLILYVSPEDILNYDNYVTDITKDIITEAKEGKLSVRSTEISQNTLSIDKTKVLNVDRNKVFIVHGHDSLAKSEVARFIERLEFQPIILHEQSSEGMTIIEKIEKYSDVGFAIVLYTPCDIGYDKENEENKHSRARQNVVFEHGYLMSKIGRNNVCALVKDDVETPNDISGLVYIVMDEHGGWKLPLAKEMKSSGYDIDFNAIM